MMHWWSIVSITISLGSMLVTVPSLIRRYRMQRLHKLELAENKAMVDEMMLGLVKQLPIAPEPMPADESVNDAVVTEGSFR